MLQTDFPQKELKISREADTLTTCIFIPTQDLLIFQQIYFPEIVRSTRTVITHSNGTSQMCSKQ